MSVYIVRYNICIYLVSLIVMTVFIYCYFVFFGNYCLRRGISGSNYIYSLFFDPPKFDLAARPRLLFPRLQVRLVQF